MQLKVDIDARAATAAFKRAPRTFQKHIRIASKRGLTLIQRHARRHHRFKRISGMLQNSITVKKDRDYIRGGIVYLETGVAIYGPRMHKGFGKHPATLWKPDEFLFKAAKKKANDVVRIIEQAVGKAIIEAGLK